jgi:hypothetical protein
MTDQYLNNIGVFGAGRSGTTWLAQIIAAAGLELIFEPLHTTEVAECGGWRPLPLFYRAGDTFPWPDVFDRAIKGEIRSEWTVRDNPGARRKVIKFIRANLMIEWILENYDILPVFIIRNPLAVVASMREQGWHISPKWMNMLLRDRRFTAHFNEGADLGGLDTRELSDVEAKATFWSILNFIPKRLGLFDRIPFVRYEELCRDPVGIVSDLAPRIDIPFSEEVRAQLYRKSFMIGRGSTEEGYDPMTAWRSVLSGAEADEICDIVSRFRLAEFLET